MERYQKHFSFLKKLSSFKSEKKRQKIFNSCSEEEFQALVEICFNLVKGNIKLSKTQKNKIQPYIPFIRQLAKKRTHKNTQKIVLLLCRFKLLLLLLLVVTCYYLKNCFYYIIEILQK